MNFVLAIICSVVFLAALILFKEKPETPPTYSEIKQHEPGIAYSTSDPSLALTDENLAIPAVKELSMREQLKVCMKDGVFMLTSLSTSCTIMYAYIFPTIFGQIAYPYGITDTAEVEKMGLYLQCFGMAGGILSSFVLTCYPKLKLANYTIMVLTILATVFFDMSMRNGNKPLIFTSCAVTGVVILSIFMVAYELAVEQTHAQGVGEAMSCGIINTISNLVSAILVVSITPSLNKETKGASTIGMSILYGIEVLGLISMIMADMFNSKRKK